MEPQKQLTILEKCSPFRTIEAAQAVEKEVRERFPHVHTYSSDVRPQCYVVRVSTIDPMEARGGMPPSFIITTYIDWEELLKKLAVLVPSLFKKEEEVGGFVGPNKEAICEACAKRTNWVVRGDYNYLQATPGWPRFTCERCGLDF